MDGALVLGVKVTVSVVFDVMVAALAAMFTAVRLLIANSNISVSNGKVVETGSKAVIGSIASPGLYESLNIDKLQ